MTIEQNSDNTDPNVRRIQELLSNMKETMNGIVRDTAKKDQLEAEREELENRLEILEEVRPKISLPKISPQ